MSRGVAWRGALAPIALALLAALAGCPGPEQPLQRADAPAPRVIVVSPAVAGMICALGAEAHLVGVSKFCTQPALADVPRIGGLLEGVGASAGKVTGTARVLRSPDDAARLGPGEIIVARVVNAGWTPLFHLAGGVVAEVGGALSHAAIVAREYGLPAVFGAAGATRIPDGATLCVDGDLGIVTVAE